MMKRVMIAVVLLNCAYIQPCYFLGDATVKGEKSRELLQPIESPDGFIAHQQRRELLIEDLRKQQSNLIHMSYSVTTWIRCSFFGWATEVTTFGVYESSGSIKSKLIALRNLDPIKDVPEDEFLAAVEGDFEKVIAWQKIKEAEIVLLEQQIEQLF